jgi:protein regulator of cytokinesis 1
MIDEAHRIIKTIKQMEASLDDNKAVQEYEPEDADLKVTYPLSRCLQNLKEKYSRINKIHKERFEQIKSM